MSTCAGENAATVIRTAKTDDYPLLIGLKLYRGQIQMPRFMGGGHLPNEVLNNLIDIRNSFDGRPDSPPASSLPDRTLSSSTLKTVPRDSSEFQEVARDFENAGSSIICLERIEDAERLAAYTDQKSIVDVRLGRTDTDRLVFHGCPYAAAEEIIRTGFDHGRIGTHGNATLPESWACSSIDFRQHPWPWILLLKPVICQQCVLSI